MEQACTGNEARLGAVEMFAKCLLGSTGYTKDDTDAGISGTGMWTCSIQTNGDRNIAREKVTASAAGVKRNENCKN